jgi:hypothetical protein
VRWRRKEEARTRLRSSTAPSRNTLVDGTGVRECLQCLQGGERGVRIPVIKTLGGVGSQDIGVSAKREVLEASMGGDMVTAIAERMKNINLLRLLVNTGTLGGAPITILILSYGEESCFERPVGSSCSDGRTRYLRRQSCSPQVRSRGSCSSVLMSATVWRHDHRRRHLYDRLQKSSLCRCHNNSQMKSNCCSPAVYLQPCSTSSRPCLENCL